jgi:hypothetical protein
MWTSKPEERLHEWREFRQQIGTQDLATAVKNTSQLWSYAPYVAHYLAADLIAEWPDPWALVHENYYCDLAKALGMLYTLYLCDHWDNTIDNLEIRVYKDLDTGDILNTVWVNRGKYILNLRFNEIVNKHLVDEKLQLKHRYSVADLGLDLK